LPLNSEKNNISRLLKLLKPPQALMKLIKARARDRHPDSLAEVRG
jgi:hypothetical protein